jgi:hypothetical protein
MTRGKTPAQSAGCNDSAVRQRQPGYLLLPRPCCREWSYLRLTLRIRKLAKLDLSPRAMAAISLPVWKQKKSGRSFRAHGPHTFGPAAIRK